MRWHYFSLWFLGTLIDNAFEWWWWQYQRWSSQTLVCLLAARSPPTACHWTRLLATPQFLVEKPENLASIFCPHILKTVAGSSIYIATLVISKIFSWYLAWWCELSVVIMVDWINKSKPRCNFCCLALNPKQLPKVRLWRVVISQSKVFLVLGSRSEKQDCLRPLPPSDHRMEAGYKTPSSCCCVIFSSYQRLVVLTLFSLICQVFSLSCLPISLSHYEEANAIIHDISQ